MKVTVTFDVSDKLVKLIPACSLERVINTSLRLIEETNDEDTDINLERLEGFQTAS